MTTYLTQAQVDAIYRKYGTARPDGFLAAARDIEAAAIQAYRDSLVAGVVLPAPVAKIYFDKSSGPKGSYKVSQVHPHTGDFPVYTADQLRQVIADALAKQVPQGWTGNVDIDAALIMLDRMDVGPDDNARVDEISALLRKLAAAPDPKEGQ